MVVDVFLKTDAVHLTVVLRDPSPDPLLSTVPFGLWRLCDLPLGVEHQ